MIQLQRDHIRAAQRINARPAIDRSTRAPLLVRVYRFAAFAWRVLNRPVEL